MVAPCALYAISFDCSLWSIIHFVAMHRSTRKEGLIRCIKYFRRRARARKTQKLTKNMNYPYSLSSCTASERQVLGKKMNWICTSTASQCNPLIRETRLDRLHDRCYYRKSANVSIGLKSILQTAWPLISKHDSKTPMHARNSLANDSDKQSKNEKKKKKKRRRFVCI